MLTRCGRSSLPNYALLTEEYSCQPTEDVLGYVMIMLPSKRDRDSLRLEWGDERDVETSTSFSEFEPVYTAW